MAGVTDHSIETRDPDPAACAGSSAPDAVDAEQARRRGRPRSVASHQAVLTTVARLLDVEQVGYDALTIERIAAEAGVGKQTIYRWWSSKAAVVLEALLAGHMRMEFAPLPDTGALRTDLHQWMDDTLELVFTEEAIGMARSIMQALVTPGAADEELLATTRFWEDTPLVERIAAERAAGRLREETVPEAMSAALTDPLLLRIVSTGRPGDSWAHSLVDTVLDSMLR